MRNLEKYLCKVSDQRLEYLFQGKETGRRLEYYKTIVNMVLMFDVALEKNIYT